jgi:hypothetical protein
MINAPIVHRVFYEFLLMNFCTRTQNNIGNNETEVRKAKKRFLNNTIYTIGYEGKELNDFIKILKDNGIEYLLDVRFSVEESVVKVQLILQMG